MVQATSADAEWLSKLLARLLLRSWSGHTHFVADATNWRPCAPVTPAPPPPPLPGRLCWVVVQLTHGFQEYWPPSQHTSRHVHTLVRLQQQVHELAPHGAREGNPNSVPLLHLLPDAVLATSSGRLLYNPLFPQKLQFCNLCNLSLLIFCMLPNAIHPYFWLYQSKNASRVSLTCGVERDLCAEQFVAKICEILRIFANFGESLRILHLRILPPLSLLTHPPAHTHHTLKELQQRMRYL